LGYSIKRPLASAPPSPPGQGHHAAGSRLRRCRHIAAYTHAWQSRVGAPPQHAAAANMRPVLAAPPPAPGLSGCGLVAWFRGRGGCFRRQPAEASYRPAVGAEGFVQPPPTCPAAPAERPSKRSSSCRAPAGFSGRRWGVKRLQGLNRCRQGFRPAQAPAGSNPKALMPHRHAPSMARPARW
jgi:hypothetical protein